MGEAFPAFGKGYWPPKKVSLGSFDNLSVIFPLLKYSFKSEIRAIVVADLDCQNLDGIPIGQGVFPSA